MAVSIASTGLASGTKIVTDTQADGTVEKNVTGTTATVYLIVIDNTANAAIEYLKLYNNSLPTVGTTLPDMVLMVTASVVRSYYFPSGIAFDTSLSYACVTTGGTAGTTNPVSAVKVYMAVSE